MIPGGCPCTSHNRSSTFHNYKQTDKKLKVEPTKANCMSRQNQLKPLLESIYCIPQHLNSNLHFLTSKVWTSWNAKDQFQTSLSPAPHPTPAHTLPFGHHFPHVFLFGCYCFVWLNVLTGPHRAFVLSQDHCSFPSAEHLFHSVWDKEQGFHKGNYYYWTFLLHHSLLRIS